MPRTAKLNRILLCVVVFVVVFTVYITSPIMTPYDSRWSIHTSMSIIHEGNTDLNEYSSELREMENNNCPILLVFSSVFFVVAVVT